MTSGCRAHAPNGAPAKFGAEQIRHCHRRAAVATNPVVAGGRRRGDATSWTAFERGARPHRIRYWLTSKPDERFDDKCADICATYAGARQRADDGVRTVSVDEMTGIQALERAAPALALKPGLVERRE